MSTSVIRRRGRTAPLATAALVATLLLVSLGGYTRGSGSGFGCGDRWPLCEGGALGGLLPRADRHMIVEWSHRWLAAVVGVLIVATVVAAWREHRRRQTVFAPAVLALVLVTAQGYLGALVVRQNLDADLVSAHLTNAMAVLALLAVVVAEANRAERRVPVGWADTGRTIWLAVAAAVTFAVIVLGSSVHNVYIEGWPLVSAHFGFEPGARSVLVHFAHRVAAAAGFVLVAALAIAGHRRGRPRPENVLVDLALGCYAVNVVLGAAHVVTEVRSSSLVVGHLGVASLAWTCLVLAALLARPVRVTAVESREAGQNEIPVDSAV